VAEEEEELRSMMERFERYVERKRLELNTRKTKIVRFRRGGGRMKKRVWRWKGEVIEEVKEIKYLGYVFQKNGGQEAHIKDRIKKAAAVMGQVWGIGKRRFGRDIGRRLWLFDKLIWTVLSYGVEIWGWEERDGIEKVEERYIRWMLGVERETPGYMVREETQREKLRCRAARRAWGYEKRLEEGGGSGLGRECRGEMKKRLTGGRIKSGWEKERENFWENRGIDIGEIEEGRDGAKKRKMGEDKGSKLLQMV